MNVIGSTALNILRGNVRWLWFCFPALPQQKSQRREAATVHQHTWPVSYQSLDHKVEESQHSTHYLVALQSHVCFYNDCNNLSSFFWKGKKKEIVFFILIYSFCFSHHFFGPQIQCFSANCCQVKGKRYYRGRKAHWALISLEKHEDFDCNAGLKQEAYGVLIQA